MFKVGVFDFLFGCHHPHTTFPSGPRTSPHVTCLDCGKEFEYDWERMRVGRAIAQPVYQPAVQQVEPDPSNQTIEPEVYHGERSAIA